jgi:hypothetical protein
MNRKWGNVRKWSCVLYALIKNRLRSTNNNGVLTIIFLVTRKETDPTNDTVVGSWDTKHIVDDDDDDDDDEAGS